MLTGREREFAALRGQIDRVSAGQGGVTGIAGPAGIGKTRLVEAALAYAKGQRCWDFVIRGFEPSADLPYWALIESLYADVAAPAPDGIDAVSPGLPGPGVTELIEALRGAQDAPRGATTGFEARDAAVNARVYTALVAVLRGLTAARPLVVLADDLQWLDTPTLNLMRYTVRLAKALPILLICAYRDDGEGASRWRPMLEDAAREGLFTELRLEGLDRAAARRLALAVAPTPLSDRAVDEVLRLAEGNPFYLGQLARAAAFVPPPAGRGAPLPTALRGFLEERLAGLSPGCRALIQAVAVVGHECPLDLLATIADAPLPQLAASLDEALATHLLTERQGPGMAGRYDFTHALLREAAARELNAVARARLHLRVADALHERRAAGGRDPAGEIADHYLEARPLAPADRALAYARAAADEAEALGAHEQAARYLAATLDLMSGAGADAPAPSALGLPLGLSDSIAAEAATASADDLAAVRSRLVLAHGLAGDIEAAEREAEAVLAHWRAVGDTRAEAEVQALLAEQLNPRLRPRDVVARADAGLALLGEERTPLAARLRFLRAHAGSMLDDSRDLLPVAEWLEAGDLTPAEPAAQVWSRLLRMLRHIWHVPDLSAVIALCHEAVEHTRRIGDRRAEAMARLWEGEFLNRDARPRQAIAALDEAQRLAREIGSAPMLVDAGSLRAEALLQLGRWQELEQVVDEILPALVRLRSTYFGYTLITAHAWSRRLRGLPWETPPGLEVRFRDSHLFVAAARANFARESVESGSTDERAARLLDWLVANVPKTGDGIVWATAGVPLLGTLALARRRADVAVRYEAVQRFPRFLQNATFGPLDLGRAAVVLKRWDAAEAHLDEAARLAAAEGLQVALARTLVERGNLYRQRSRRGDRARAAEVLKRAVELCDGLGLVLERDRARALLHGLPGVPGPSLPAGLTPREAEVLRHLAGGRTNRQIAEALTISEKTVEQHLLNIYQKLQVDSRARAIAFAYAHGLAE